MGLFRKFFGGGKAKPEASIEIPPCPHTAIVPRWANADDMGKQDKVTGYYCQACGASFTPEEMKAASR